MKFIKFSVTTVVVLLMCSCSTPYQPKLILGGYNSSQLGNNTYKVTFKGNQHTPAQTVYDYLLRRCAEITIKEECKYFIVYEDSSYIDKIVMDTGSDLDDQIDEFQLGGHRPDAYLLDRKPEIITDPLQTLKDQKTKIDRTFQELYIETKSTSLVGVFKIQIFADFIQGSEGLLFSAEEILEKYQND